MMKNSSTKDSLVFHKGVFSLWSLTFIIFSRSLRLRFSLRSNLSLLPSIGLGHYAPSMQRQTRYKSDSSSTSAKSEPKVKKIDAKVNILTIDSVIKNNFVKDIGSIDQMKEDLKGLLAIIAFSPYSDDRATAEKQEDILRRRIKGIQLGSGLTVYQLLSDPLIRKYRELVPTTRKAFGDPEKSSDVQKIVADYLKIARNYIDLENFRGLEAQSEPCQECGSVVFEKTEEYGITVCDCGLAKDILNVAPSYNDSKRVNCSTRFKHNARVYLEDAMDSFECKQGEISPNTLAIVKKEMALRGVTPKNVSKDDIYSYLTMNRLSESYADINAIFCSITGSDPPDLTEYRAELLEMSSQFEPVCKRLISDRVNALTVLWKLYMFLCLLDYPCSRQDFYCLKTTIKQEEHQSAWDMVINELIELYPNDKTSKGKARWRHLEKDNYVSYSTLVSPDSLDQKKESKSLKFKDNSSVTKTLISKSSPKTSGMNGRGGGVQRSARPT